MDVLPRSYFRVSDSPLVIIGISILTTCLQFASMKSFENTFATGVVSRICTALHYTVVACICQRGSYSPKYLALHKKTIFTTKPEVFHNFSGFQFSLLSIFHGKHFKKSLFFFPKTSLILLSC